MRKYKVITQKDRQLIATLYDAGTPLPTIAAAVDVSLATLYRELARGYTGAFNPKGCRAYSAAKAQQTVDQNIKRRGRSPADTKKRTE